MKRKTKREAKIKRLTAEAIADADRLKDEISKIKRLNVERLVEYERLTKKYLAEAER